MTRRQYLLEYNKLVKRFINAGLRYIRRVFWQLTRKQSARYSTQIRAMRQTLRGL